MFEPGPKMPRAAVVARALALALFALACVVSRSEASDAMPDGREMARRVSESLRAIEGMDLPTGQYVLELIGHERFEQFERLSKSYEDAFAKDPLRESPLDKLYDAIDGSNEAMLAKLDAWVKQRPSYVAYGARGIYKSKRGFFLRGSKYVSETPPENLEKMAEMHRQAVADLTRALELNKKFQPAYKYLIYTEQASGSTDQARAILDRCVKELPTTYYVRLAYLWALRPRWGGSYEQMQAYANSLDREALVNPRIWTLRAEAPAEVARSALLTKDYAIAVRFYTEALTYGDRLEFLEMRGKSYLKLGQNAAALADFKRYREYVNWNGYINQQIEVLGQQAGGADVKPSEESARTSTKAQP